MKSKTLKKGGKEFSISKIMSQVELPYSIPKNVPKWVLGFPEFLENSLRVGGTETTTLRQTWKSLEARHWSAYQACGKKRAKKDKNGSNSDDADASSSGKAKEKLGKHGPKLSKRVREHLKQLERIAQEMGSPEMANTVAQLRNDLEQ